jgi:curved DNA-binding protein CbpA
MSYSALPSEWIKKFADPYAILGIPVAADDRRVSKRYRDIAKLLHPDRYALAGGNETELATQLFARLVNPAYEQLKQDRGRAEHTALLRIKVRRLCREGPLTPESEIARTLMEHPATGVDTFYEQAISTLAQSQYESLELEQFESITRQISELNLVYLQLKMGDGIVRERRTGLIAAAEAQPVQFTPAPTNPEVVTESYDQRHYRRAQEYAKKGAWNQAIQELRDAIKIKATKSEYHSLLGVAYLHQQKFPGMAKVHLRRAYELNPKDPLVLKFGAKVGLPVASPGRTHNNSQRSQPPKPRSAPARSSQGSPKPSQSVDRRGFWDWLLGKRSDRAQFSDSAQPPAKTQKRGWLAALFGGR